MDFKEIIKRHLDKMAQQDFAFAERYKSEKKTLDGCVKYIMSQAKKKATHNKFIRMMIRQEEQNKLAREYRKIEQERRQRKELDELYVKNRKRFFDMVLKSGSLEVRVLRSVDEFLEEGEYMQHCVYKCRYWDLKTHPKSLIMSATVGGHKCETIEVNLENYTIAQCFGKHDLFTNYHKKIVDFVNKHMDVIKKYNQGIKQRKAA